MSAQADDSDSATSDMDEKTATVGRRCLVVDMLRATNGRIAELEVNITDWSARPPSYVASRPRAKQQEAWLLHQFIHQ